MRKILPEAIFCCLAYFMQLPAEPMGEQDGADFSLPRNYEEWVLYFRHYKTYCEMLAKRGNVQRKVGLRRIALPYLAEVCGQGEELSKQEQRAIVIAQTISCMGFAASLLHEDAERRRPAGVGRTVSRYCQIRRSLLQ